MWGPISQKDNQPFVVMFVGLPGTGKSMAADSLSVHLARKGIKNVIVGRDREIDKYAAKTNQSYNEVFDNKRQLNVLGERASGKYLEHVAAFENIIIDETNLTPSRRRRWLRKLPQSYTKIAVSMYVPDRSKHNKRLAGRVGKVIPEDVMGRMRGDYVEPMSSEGFDLVIEVDNSEDKL